MVPLPRVLSSPLLLAIPLRHDSHRLIHGPPNRPNNPRRRRPLPLPIENKATWAPLPPLASLVLGVTLVLAPIPPVLVRAPVPDLVVNVRVGARNPLRVVGRGTTSANDSLIFCAAAALQHLRDDLASEKLVPRELHPPVSTTLTSKQLKRSDDDSLLPAAAALVLRMAPLHADGWMGGWMEGWMSARRHAFFVDLLNRP